MPDVWAKPRLTITTCVPTAEWQHDGSCFCDASEDIQQVTSRTWPAVRDTSMLPPVRASPVSSTKRDLEDHVLTIPSGGEEDTVAYMLQCLQC